MAANEFMPDPTIAQTDPERSEGNDRFPEVTRKKDAHRLHGKDTVEAAVHARADTPVSSAACCELYSRIRNRFIPLSGEWLPKAGFLDGMPVKIA